MPLQVDEGGGEALRRLIESLGVSVRTGTATSKISGKAGQVARMSFAEGPALDVDVVVFAGVRPRDELAREAGLEVGERGGVVVDDACRTGDPSMGHRRGRLHRGPLPRAGRPGLHHGRDRRRPPARRRGNLPRRRPLDQAQAAGVDVASFGDAFAQEPGRLEVVISDPVAGV